MIIFTLAGGLAGTVAPLTVGAIMAKKRTRQMDALRPQLERESSESPPVSWRLSPYATPDGAGLALELRF